MRQFIALCLLSVATATLPAAELILAPVIAADRVTVKENTLIKVKLNPDERLVVTTSHNRGEVSFVDTEYWADSTGAILGQIWTARTGYYAMVIVPDDHQKELRQVVVYIESDDDDPTPPPGPDEPDEPDKPVDVPNQYKIGKMAYDYAMKINNKHDARLLSEIYYSAASKLAAMSGTNLIDEINESFRWAHDQTNARLSQVSKWDDLRFKLKTQIEDNWRNGYSTKEHAVGTLNELGRAMELAAR